ncbi:hypothetical protein [Halodesulfovibrio spirochaetisodalis]|uniref:Uncharacterized protein n=1 Tax=Halodesulfovibrio spirochaetisodalis TaxID=1560234 RepID=A0A1B7XC52_9BACT|nr:hypothetical protein [Halodesulfovibrio spirochaetisodalis]OBQ51498.1 hypothetical protein SP90_09815 [Halodesulfovibrio spirochaetisodalis]
MKKNNNQGYTVLTSENAQIGTPSQPQQPALFKYIVKLVFFLVRFALILLGLFIAINRLASFAATGQIVSLAFALAGLILVGIGVGKNFRTKTYSSLRKIIHFLSGALGLLLQAGFFNTMLEEGGSSKALLCLAIGCGLLVISYLTRDPQKKRSKAPTNEMQRESDENEDKMIFDTETLTDLLPEIITDMLHQTKKQATCTSIHSISYKGTEPTGAIAVLNTGEEIQIDMSISEDDGLAIELSQPLDQN